MSQSDVELVASAVLPANGALFTSRSIGVSGKKEVSLYCRYTRGGAAGAITIRVECSYDGDDANFYQDAVQSEQSTSSGSNTLVFVQRQDFVYKPTLDPLESFIISLTDPFQPAEINTNSIRVVCNETGNAGSPGTFQCQLVTQD